VVATGIKLPWEHALHTSSSEWRHPQQHLSVELREKLGQNLAIALLSGFRGIVADFVWISAHNAWADQVWHKMKENIQLAVVLQPQSISFWDLGAWHMAWNASYGESTNRKYPSDAYRKKRQLEWIETGRAFLEEGIQNNPDQYDLYFKMGWLIYQKKNDPLAAVPYLIKASEYPEAPLYVVRMVGILYAKGGDHLHAYQWWKKLWAEDHEKNPNQFWHKIAEWGHEAEEKLGISPQERVFPSKSKSIIR
jgi:hypothetical protein